MAGIGLIIRDDDGNIIPYSHKRVYGQNIGSCDSDSTEGAIRRFRHDALKDMLRDLLNNARAESDSRIKKKDLPVTEKHR